VIDEDQAIRAIGDKSRWQLMDGEHNPTERKQKPHKSPLGAEWATAKNGIYQRQPAPSSSSPAEGFARVPDEGPSRRGLDVIHTKVVADVKNEAQAAGPAAWFDTVRRMLSATSGASVSLSI
jgi:hypothetical protein